MPINFPDSPAENDSFTSGGKKWIFNGSTWNLITANSYTIPTGEVTAAKIASNAVTEAKINDGAVTQAKLASGLSGITVTTTANRSAVIPSPFTGQFIFLTDTSQLQRWDGSAWVVAIPTVPTGAPTSLAVSGSPTSSTVTLTFSAGGDGGSSIINYQYALSTNGGTTYGDYTVLSPADGSSPITITGLVPLTTYHVKLKAVNALGAGASESTAISFTTGNMSIEALIVGGGGGGGCSLAGGGGGGGVATGTTSVGIGTQTIVVGAGGAGGSSTGVFGGTGVTSSAFGQAVKGGTGGNSRYGGSATTGANGGGGAAGSGGRSGSQGVIDTAISGFTTYGGFRGGNNGGDPNNYPGGGGGGANGNGTDVANSSKGGNGGAGIQIANVGSCL